MGGGHDNHNTRDGNTFSVTIISWQVVTSLRGLTSASGPQWQECNARAQPRASTRNDNDSLPALQRYTLHVTMHPSPTQPAPHVHYTPHNPTQPWPWQWHWAWSRDCMSHMCNVRGNGLPSQATGKHPLHFTHHTPSPSPQTAARHRYQWGHCPESLDKCLD